VPSLPREAQGNRTANDDGSTRLAKTHKAQIITGRMSTKQTNGREFSVPRANIAQRRPVNIANAKTSYEKYVTLARAAALSGDAVETENYYQHAEHYFRLMKDERIRRGQQEVDGAPGVEGNEQPS
jgi:hypothetical protein